jgi:tetratricopeptide (TPR) repeat protein
MTHNLHNTETTGVLGRLFSAKHGEHDHRTAEYPVMRTKYATWLILLIMIAGALLRLHRLGANSMWVDEIGQVLLARGALATMIRGIATRHVAAAPLDYIVTSLALRLDSSEFVLRLPSVIWGVLSIYFLYLLGISISASRKVGLTAAGLLAICPAHIEFSQEVRFYSLFVFLSLLSVYGFYHAMNEGKPRHWALVIFAVVLSFYTHYYTAFLTASMFSYGLVLMLLAKQPRVRSFFVDMPRVTPKLLLKLCLSLILAALVFAPWVLYAKGGYPSSFVFKHVPLNQVISMPVIGYYAYTASFLGEKVLPIVATLGVVLGLFFRRRISVLLVAILIVISVPGVLILDKWFSYFYSYRQLLFLTPFYLILAAMGIVYCSAIILRRDNVATRIMIGVLLFGFALSFRPYVEAYYNRSKTDWREVAIFLRSAMGHDDAVVTLPDGLQQYLTYYQPILQDYMVSESLLQGGEKEVDAYSHVWLIGSTQDSVQEVSTHVEQMGWHFISAQSGGLYWAYAGKEEASALLEELARTPLTPRILSGAGLLFALQKIDPAIAMEVGQRSVSVTKLASPSMSNLAQATLVREVGRVYFDSGQTGPALSYLHEALKYDAKNEDTLIDLGYVYLRTGNCDEAIKFLSTSLKYHSQSYWANSLFGEACSCKDRWLDAASAYRRAFEIQPDPALLLAEAQAYIEIGANQQALSVLQKAITTFSDDPDIIGRATDMLQRLDQH